jgi:hypothetical protein
MKTTGRPVCTDRTVSIAALFRHFSAINLCPLRTFDNRDHYKKRVNYHRVNAGGLYLAR